jgi:hypothetical protein
MIGYILEVCPEELSNSSRLQKMGIPGLIFKTLQGLSWCL